MVKGLNMDFEGFVGSVLIKIKTSGVDAFFLLDLIKYKGVGAFPKMDLMNRGGMTIPMVCLNV